MRHLHKYQNLLVLLCVLSFIIVGTALLLRQWQVQPDDWQTAFNQHKVDPEDIVSSGMGRDHEMIAIDHPIFVTNVEAAQWLPGHDSVIVVVYQEVVRAYPLRILIRHEIVNDIIAQLPIAVTFCPLCNSPIVYERQIDGHMLRMGVSGNLYASNFLMYDHLTESWWQQFTGEAIVGDLSGQQLPLVPSQVVGFDSYRQRYPMGMVLAGDNRENAPNYDMSPYGSYAQMSSPLMQDQAPDPRLEAMQEVLATQIGLVTIAYPFAVLAQHGVLHDEVDDQAIVIFWQPNARSPYDRPDDPLLGQAAIFSPEVNGQTLHFRYEDGHIYDDATSSEWNIFGEAIDGVYQGTALHKYDCYTHFWFAWAAAHPETLVYGQ